VATRVALGHTGRPLVVRPAITVAYALVAAAALVRIFGPALLPLGAVHVLACAAVLWAAAFGIFLVVYVPILFAPRAAYAASSRLTRSSSASGSVAGSGKSAY